MKRIFSKLHTRRKIIYFLAFILLGSVAFTASDLYRKIAQSQRLLNEAYKYLVTNYVDELNTDEYTSSSLRNLLSELDPYTVYLEKEERDNIDLLTKGKYGGVGIQLSKRDNELTVIAPMDDTPAQRAGIISGDVITEIDEIKVIDLTLDEAAKMIRGVKGTEVKLTIKRFGEDTPIIFNLTRAEITVNDVTFAEMITESTGYIRLTRFSKNAPLEMQAALRELEKQNASEIIIDLRDNPGGLLASAIELLDMFVPKGQLLLSTKGRTKDSNKTYFSRRPHLVSENVKMAVLLNRGSASASEIVAGVFQDLDRGVIIGQPSFGKGLVQSVYNLDNKRSLKITTAKYYIPSGRLIQKPDYVSDDIVFKTVPEDSIFSTLGGRKVKGGGGIHPDYTVDVPKLPLLTRECWRKGMFFSYAQKNKKNYETFEAVTADLNLLTDFEKFLVHTELDVKLPGEQQFNEAREKLSEFTEDNKKFSVAMNKAEEVIVEKKSELFEKEKNELKRGLYLEFASLFQGTEGRIRESIKNDLVIQEAIDLLSDQMAYTQTFISEN